MPIIQRKLTYVDYMNSQLKVYFYIFDWISYIMIFIDSVVFQ